VSPDTSGETATPLTDGCNNNQMVQFSASTNGLCFSSARSHWNKTSQVRILHRLRWKCNCSCCVLTS